MSEVQALYKFTLTTNKTVHLREPRISHTRLAAQVAGKKAGDNQAYLNVILQEEIAKQLIVKIDDVEVMKSKIENLDSLFSVKEYGQVIQAIQMIGGEDEGEGKPVLVIDTSGS